MQCENAEELYTYAKNMADVVKIDVAKMHFIKTHQEDQAIGKENA